jgi:GNAT superfamily N-acetyltransferase
MSGPADRYDLVLVRVALADRRAQALEDAMLAETAERYRSDRPGPVDGADFDPPDGLFVLAVADGSPVGCGGFRRLAPDQAELKRMYVVPSHRGKAVGRRLLRFLEEQALTAGYSAMWLETGTEQPEAVSLYVSSGYRPIDPYGEFKDDRRSLGFSKTLCHQAAPEPRGH